MILNCAEQWQRHPDISLIKQFHSSSSTTTQWAHWIVLEVVCLATTHDWRLCLLPVYLGEQEVTIMEADSPLKDATIWLFYLSVDQCFVQHSWLFFLSPLTAHFTSLSIFCSATVGSFVSLSAVFDSRRGLIHVQRLHLFPPSNLCCQRFYSVWMARLSCVCRTVLWVVDTFLHVQHETDCSR